MWKLIGFSAAILTTFGFVPQIIKMHKTNSIENISLLTLIQFSVGISLWVVYGIHLGDIVIISANIISLSTLIVAIIIYFRIKNINKNI